MATHHIQLQPVPQVPVQPVQSHRARPVSEIELDHLVDIKIDSAGSNLSVKDRRKQLVLREALVEWKEQVEAFEAKVEKRTKRTEQWTNEIYQLVALYSVFVGVVFTAVLQSSRVECKHIWSPLVLCGIAYIVLLVVIIKKSIKINEDRNTIAKDEAFRKLRVEHIRVLKSKGRENFDFGHPKFEAEEEKRKVHERSSGVSSWPWWIIGILSFFTLVLLFSFIHILCINPSACSCPSGSR